MTQVESKTGQVKYQSLSDKAYETLRDAIIRGNFPPGKKLTEAGCAQDIGISRACVREAFITLESEGLVRRTRNKYTEVEELTDRDMRDILALRSAIEILSVETCIAQNTIPVDELKSCAERISAINKRWSTDVVELMDADFDFHEAIVRAAGNKKSLNVWNALKSQMKMLLYIALENKQSTRKFESGQDHKTLIDAIVDHDIQRAATLIKLHVDRCIGPARSTNSHRPGKMGVSIKNSKPAKFPFSSPTGN